LVPQTHHGRPKRYCGSTIEDDEKKNGLFKDHFGCRSEGRKVKEEEADRVINRATGIRQEEIELWIRKNLGETSNKSAPGPNGIEYRIIQRVLNIKLGRELIREVAGNLSKGKIPYTL